MDTVQKYTDLTYGALLVSALILIIVFGHASLLGGIGIGIFIGYVVHIGSQMVIFEKTQQTLESVDDTVKNVDEKMDEVEESVENVEKDMKETSEKVDETKDTVESAEEKVDNVEKAVNDE